MFGGTTAPADVRSGSQVTDDRLGAARSRRNKPKEAMGETLMKIRRRRGCSGVPPYDRRSNSLAICPLRAAVVLVGRSLPAHRWDARACSAGARSTSAAVARRLATIFWGFPSRTRMPSRTASLCGGTGGRAIRCRNDQLIAKIACRPWLTTVTASATAQVNWAGR